VHDYTPIGNDWLRVFRVRSLTLRESPHTNRAIPDGWASDAQVYESNSSKYSRTI